MSDALVSCYWCQQAQAVCGAMRRPACNACAESIAAFYRGEREDKRMGRNCGFASMAPVKVREISSLGGKAAHAKGTAHKWTSESAKEAGRKGGVATREKRAARLAKFGTPPTPEVVVDVPTPRYEGDE